MFGASGVFEWVLSLVYWAHPHNNIVHGIYLLMQTIAGGSERWGVMLFIIGRCAFWTIVSGFLHERKLYWRL